MRFIDVYHRPRSFWQRLRDWLLPRPVPVRVRRK